MLSLARNRKRVIDEIVPGYVLLLPAAIVLCVFTLYPIVYAFVISFKDFNFLDPSGAHWVGFRNYAALFKDAAFVAAVRNTGLLLLIVVPAQTLLGFVLALLLNAKLRARGMFRTLYFMPYVSPPVAIASIIGYLFTLNGPMTALLHRAMNLPNVPWYATSPFAFILIILITVWAQTGLYMILFLSGLQAIPTELYEAARVDGATSWETVKHITIPLLKPTTFTVLVMGVIATLQIFDVPYMVSGIGGGVPGGPGNSTMTLVMYLYTQAFGNFNMGMASAAAFVTFAAIFLITVLQYRYFNSDN